jgi:hypothetical protein
MELSAEKTKSAQDSQVVQLTSAAGRPPAREERNQTFGD